jgi:hypothetical protein
VGSDKLTAVLSPGFSPFSAKIQRYFPKNDQKVRPNPLAYSLIGTESKPFLNKNKNE